MPPGDINNNNLINTDNTLTQEAVATLLLQFESHRKSLRCPHCEKMGQFRRNGSTKTDPPMPIFRCHGCGKTFKAQTMMYIVQSLVSPNNLVSSPNNKTSGVFHNTQPTQNSNTNDQAHDMQTLLEMIKRLSTELAAARAEIAKLTSTGDPTTRTSDTAIYEYEPIQPSRRRQPSQLRRFSCTTLPNTSMA
ncbi:hypothetical protein RMATCC62417_18798 [Rhizopus microsporus]|nr:hypothetical protein RMATCC62417_18798 [Rhizopus microsporus]